MVYFIKTLMNVDQIDFCLLKLMVNFRIRPNSNYKKTLSGYRINAFTFF